MNNNEILFKPNGLILATANKTITSSEFKLYDTLLQRCQVTKDSNWRKAEISREEIKKIITNNDKTIFLIYVTHLIKYWPKPIPYYFNHITPNCQSNTHLSVDFFQSFILFINILDDSGITGKIIWMKDFKQIPVSLFQ